MKHGLLFIAVLIFGLSSVAFSDDPVVLFGQDFVNPCPLTSGWIVLSGDWSCDGADGLVFDGKKGNILAPVTFEGCDLCEISTTFIYYFEGRVSLLGWYSDANNFVELTAHPDKDREKIRWTLRQIVNGRVAAQKKFDQTWPLDPGEVWLGFILSFDGLTFRVFHDDNINVLFEMDKAPVTSPFGTVGYKYKNASGVIGGIVVTGQAN